MKQPKKIIEEMERELGLDKIKPIALSASDEALIKQEGDTYRKWYEEELRELYKKVSEEK